MVIEEKKSLEKINIECDWSQNKNNSPKYIGNFRFEINQSLEEENFKNDLSNNLVGKFKFLINTANKQGTFEIYRKSDGKYKFYHKRNIDFINSKEELKIMDDHGLITIDKIDYDYGTYFNFNKRNLKSPEVINIFWTEFGWQKTRLQNNYDYFICKKAYKYYSYF